MVKFLKPTKVVVMLQGRYAGRKAVIVKNFDDGEKGKREYGHALVAGIAKYPRKVIKKASQKTIDKRSRLKAFVKYVNYNHIMPTRYSLDVDLKDIVTAENLETSAKKVATRKDVKAAFEDKFKSGKNKWFFTKLRF